MSTPYRPNPDALTVGANIFEHKRIQNQFLENEVTHAFTTKGFSLKATMSGVVMEGKIDICTMHELQQFAELMSEAWQARHSLRLTLTNESGH